LPRVSVVIPTLNRDYMIKDAIESVLTQTFKDYEIIVVDDGSDNTEQEVLSFNSDKIIYIHRRTPKGVAEARNYAVNNYASGEYIAFLDSDDVWIHPKKLEWQVKILNEYPQVGLVHTAFQHQYSGTVQTTIERSLPRKPYDASKRILKRNFIGSSTVVLRNSLFHQAGGFKEDLQYSEDWELWIRLSKHCLYKYIMVPTMLQHPRKGGLSANQMLIIENHLRILSEYYTLFKQEHAFSKILLTESLWAKRDLKRYGLHKELLCQAIKLDPLNPSIVLLSFVLRFLGCRPYNRLRKVMDRW